MMEQPAWLNILDYPFASQWIKIQGDAIHFIDEGKGTPVLFLHGSPLWSYAYRNVIKELLGECRCIALDQLGFGLSEKPQDGDYSLEAQLDRIKRLIDESNLRKFILVADGNASTLALKLMSDRPEHIKNLLLLHPKEHTPSPLWKRMLNLQHGWEVRKGIKASLHPKNKLSFDEYLPYRRPFWHREDRVALGKRIEPFATFSFPVELGKRICIIWGQGSKKKEREYWQEISSAGQQEVFPAVKSLPMVELPSAIAMQVRIFLLALAEDKKA
ncbi:MAG: alpha/beta fold hydrolase [Bacteroidota bacterium]